MDRIAQLQTFLAQTPKDNFVRHALALEYIKAGNDVAARVLFEELLADSPDYTGSYYHLGKLYERSHLTDLAIACYEKGMAAAKQAGEKHAYNELQSAYEDLVY
ncbi:hypothetical protein [Deminuibacter soli]|uniref:Uncharacterized protein n=1 Tax=Deminuibacter soli TaxID=2291815 RepID=A0A3E1NIA0_9BACT|nr:hypothetical protein [Deminuibacter soli]RFM27601.1 hypothetical protein DXN05_12850 [Deminuibacter soli]